MCRNASCHKHSWAAPVLAIGGKLDGATPPDHAEEIANLVSNGRASILPDVGHHAPFEAPEAITTALRNFADSLQAA
jgi:pimeloyl-ACP methyl ester carboxylesterase